MLNENNKMRYATAAIFLVAGMLIATLTSSFFRAFHDTDSYNSKYEINGALEDYDSEENGMQEVGDSVAKTKGSDLFSTAGEDQKLVYSGDVTIGTDNIKKSQGKIEKSMKDTGATYESVSETATSKTMTLRVPKKNFMQMYDSLSNAGGTITDSQLDIQDKTKTFTDNSRRIDVLQTEYDELKKLMSQAKNVDEVLSIRDRMTELTYELETLKGANDTIDYDANYSRLQITLQLNGTHTKSSLWYEVKEAFSDGLCAIKMILLGVIRLWWLILAAAGGYAIWRFKKKK